MEQTLQSGRAPGDILATRYRLKQRIAEGGIGDVWLAEHLHLKQNVAIKFLNEKLTADPETSRSALERFRFEAQVSALLASRTAYVVNIHDAGDSEAGPFLAMEYVPGRSLADELRKHGPMKPGRVGAILEQVASALETAHAAGIVHRDIKPANILVCDRPDGSPSVKLADFGIAKTTNLDLPLDRPKDTGVTAMMGTPGFMSPEQLRRGSIHPAMDVWALGVSAYKLLTGAIPFEARTTIDIADKILNEPFPPPSSHHAGLPIALDAWFARVLAKDPADRFATAKEMSEAYRAALDPDADFPVTVATSSFWVRPVEITPPTRTAETAVEGWRRARPRLGALEPTTLTSEQPKTHLRQLTDPGRTSGRWFGTMVAAAVVVLLGALLVTRAGGGPGPQEAFASGAPQRSDLQGSCPRTGVLTALAPLHGLLEPEGPSVLPSHSLLQQPSRAIATSGPLTRSAPLATPPTDAPAPAPAPIRSERMPKRDPSTVF